MGLSKLLDEVTDRTLFSNLTFWGAHQRQLCFVRNFSTSQSHASCIVLYSTRCSLSHVLSVKAWLVNKVDGNAIAKVSSVNCLHQNLMHCASFSTLLDAFSCMRYQLKHALLLNLMVALSRKVGKYGRVQSQERKTRLLKKLFIYTQHFERVVLKGRPRGGCTLRVA